jgi:TonB-linked SusC/RagA family outer membrane protein
MKLIRIVWLLTFLLVAGNLHAQTRLISGRVLDDKKIPLPGVTIAEVGNLRNGTASDENGVFKITLKSDNAVLTVSAIGFVSGTVFVKTNRTLTVTLKPDTKGLNEVVVVGYSTQKRITNTGAVSSIKASEIETEPVSSIQNTLDGRLPGFFSTQRSGQPGSDAADFYIRGVNSINGDNQPLVIVDDIQWTYAQVAELDANEIETISILKDAATTAVYGVRGANGVLLITTKRGTVSKPRINVTTQTGVNQVIQYPTYMDAYATAVLQNEAFINDSYGLSSPLTLPWTSTDLQKFKDGSDPYGHPNVNWQNVLLNNSSSQDSYNVDIRGGNSKVRYFTSFGYFTQDGLLKDFAPAHASDVVDNNYFYNRINFRSNLDITPTKTLDVRFDLNGRFETINNPNGILDNSGSLFKEIEEFYTLSPLTMPLINPNGTYGFANQSYAHGYVNPVDRLANSGYKRNFNNNFQINVGADQKLDFITRGLSAKINVSYSQDINENRQVTRDPAGLPAYYYNSSANSYTGNTHTQLSVFGQSATNSAFSNTTNTQGSLNYDHSFGSNHVYALALINQISSVNGGAVPLNFRGLTGRVGYDYKQKYLIEFDVARNGNDLFRPNQAYGIFPAVSAGWNLGEEHFFKKLFPFIDLFKFRGSYGLVGSDSGYPTVLSVIPYTLPSGVNYFGNGATEGGLVNPNVTWEKSRKTDAGLDVNMMNGKLTMSADYFYEHRYDQLITQAGVPSIIGQSLPSANVGITDNKGVELQITYKNKVGALGYSVSAQMSHYKNKIIYISEAPDYPYQAQTGHQLGLVKGYHFIGFYQPSDFDPTTGQVKAGIPKPLWSTIQPGDLKYADLNGDGVITSADVTWLSQPNIPTTTYGFNLGFTYKGFSLAALIQGSFGYAISVNAEGTDAFNGNIQPLMLQSWTPQNAATAIYPRIGFNTNINNITWQTVSDYSYANGSYVRLKSLELGYQLPASWIKKIGVISSCRFYTSGYNLLTIRNTGRFQVDPEISNGQGFGYPITANYTFGAQLGF